MYVRSTVRSARTGFFGINQLVSILQASLEFFYKHCGILQEVYSELPAPVHRLVEGRVAQVQYICYISQSIFYTM